MSEITVEDREKIAKNLTELGATLPCPRCGKNELTLINEYFHINIINGHIPLVMIVCNNCKFLSSHAINHLIIEEKESN